MTNYTMRPLLYSERAQQAVQDQTMEDLASKLVKRWGQTDFRKLEPLVEVEVTFYFISTGVIVVDKDDTDTALSLSLSHLNGRYEGQKGRLPPHRIELWTFRLLGERSATEP